MSRVREIPAWQRAIIILASAVVGLFAVLGLQWGRPVLIPMALAAFLTFLLNPIVMTLQKYRLGRVPAVMIAVMIAGASLGSLSWIMARQVGAMLAELPRNTANIKAKVKAVRMVGSSPVVEQFTTMLEEISREFHVPPGNTDQMTDNRRDISEGLSRAPDTVVLQSETTTWSSLGAYAGSALESLATIALAMVLLVFFLLQREDLRDRVVLLAGRTRLTLTSKAVEDATRRISRYLVMLALVNGSFGILLGLGLFLLGVPYALLWGLLAAMCRFIPYIGPWVGAAFPIMMSLATSNGWWQPLSVFGFVLILELITNNAVEPLVFGRSTGVSPAALLVSAAFWAYLWGPIGLVLSAPFAVCLVVLGKNIPQLSFLNLLLGDEPALHGHVSYYQRLLLHDQRAADQLVLGHLKANIPENVYDEILIPALNCAKRDEQRDFLVDEDRQAILRGMQESLSSIDHWINSKTTTTRHCVDADSIDKSPLTVAPARIVGCPATDDFDEQALEMLSRLLNPTRWKLEVTAVATLTSELVASIRENPPAMICIASLPPGGRAHARYLCKRLRAVSRDVLIIVGRWGNRRPGRIEHEELEHAGADLVTTSLLETCARLETRLPLIPKGVEHSAIDREAKPIDHGPPIPLART